MARSKTVKNDLAVVIYARVSTEEQGKSHLGLDAQLEACKRMAEYEGLEVVGIYEESISGKVDPMERPVFTTAINDAINSGARLLIAKLDRFSRDVYHISSFLNGYMVKNCPRLIVAETPNASEFELNLRAALAQEERRLISERTKAALAVKRSQGASLGKVGRAAATSNKREATQDAFQLMLELHKQGYSYQTIADKLNQQGYTTSRGGQWDKSVVFRRIKNYQKEQLIG
ncbi:recombinase family protein [Richelia sinica]|uniref:recombinase family protein n=1 Tax=Richelia sinica TaxID=1357545 RepID=UPI0016832F30|nr:recombinase family protein [Richelia sinica]MBD2667247.1 recombinase family protein [Richelia sinica FACHB-800]